MEQKKPEGLRLDPEEWYRESQMRLFGLDGDALEEARDSGALTYRDVGGEVWYKGAWLLAWLEGTEVAR